MEDISEYSRVDLIKTKILEIFPTNIHCNFLIENITIKDYDSEQYGDWQLRVDPRFHLIQRVTSEGEQLVFRVTRKTGKLLVTRISTLFGSNRPLKGEAVITGSTFFLNNPNEQEIYLGRDVWDFFLNLPKRRKDLQFRLKQWEDYLNANLTIIQKKRSWIAFRDLKRISKTQVELKISTKHYSRNIFKSFYPNDEVSIIKLDIPEQDDFSIDEDDINPISLGEISENENIRKKLPDYRKNARINNDWISLILNLNEKYLLDDSDQDGGDDPLTRIFTEGLMINSIFRDELPFELQNKAINRLKEGQASNPHLEDFIFDISSARVPFRNDPITRETLIEKQLNDDQFDAIQKAINAPDIALIQGPPGTGKTTVIAELCHQVVLRGGKALISSQTNLAVDNALNRIANETIIRPIRLGRNVTEEGYDFVETNVVKRWFTGIKKGVITKIEEREKLSAKLKLSKQIIIESKTFFQTKSGYLNRLEEINRTLSNLRSQINTQNTQLEEIELQIYSIKTLKEKMQIIINKNILLNDHDLNILYEEFPSIKSEIINKFDKIFNTPNPLIFNKNYLESSINLITITILLIEIKSSIQEINQVIYDLKSILKSVSSKSNKTLDEKKKKQSEIVSMLTRITDSNKMQELTNQLQILNQELKSLEKKEYAETSETWTRKILSLNAYFENVTKILEIIEHSENVELNDLKTSLGPKNSYHETIAFLISLNQFINKTDLFFTKESINILKNDLSEKEKQLTNLTLEKGKKIESASNNESQYKQLIQEKTVLEENFLSKKTSLLNKLNKFTKENDLETSFNREITKEIDLDLIKVLEDKNNEMMSINELETSKTKKWLPLQKKWVEKIEQSLVSEYESLKETYLDYANVVGVTCSEAGKWKFYGKKNREFDLVIIDEVSKATPPELLMPMLLGKQIILVGDHRQLPPTYTISKEEIPYLEVEEEDIEKLHRGYEDLVTSSYFQDLFEQASIRLRHPLTLQYRMHHVIMQAINQFYPNNPLRSGLKNDDVERSHPYKIIGGDGSIKSRKNFHITWIDTTYRNIQGRLYHNLEDQEQSRSKSRFNKYEVSIIKEILLSFETQITNLLNTDSDTKIPEIAIISFYMAQVRQLKDMFFKEVKKNKIQKIATKVRIGSVDRFQGMERSIVIVSLVSSPKQGFVTRFVKEFRRLNVAFSRAQSLLIIVGSKTIFYDVPVDIRLDDGTFRKTNAYRNIINLIESGIDGSGDVIQGYELLKINQEGN